MYYCMLLYKIVIDGQILLEIPWMIMYCGVGGYRRKDGWTFLLDYRAGRNVYWV